ncbi:hypothetical protein LPB142_17425 (plasmid) [Rhodobacter xanthinilyticus]|uniref:Uncharacterized protein n=2 Tax=Rhodobacter xanthinilyticus TaxID=1850250 RepID=A0A1D9MHA6_9RHOB|nr:hypothetical protein LPB142_16860 [Rhodobacter xanthinilyticus]AOZ71244.1 hypothetical protein LPB142_17425 [Rhodobacter xanthinilyticus]
MIASLASSLGIALASAAHSQDATGFIGGIAPNARPEGAPVIVQFTPDANWQENAAHGIEAPIPPTILAWLDDQGAWFTPFIHPGMTGPYDLRHWHDIE